MSADSSACPACQREEAAASGERSPIYSDRSWRAEVVPGYDAPGWVVVEARRHINGLWAMDGEEARALGPLVARIAAVLREEFAAERVYLMYYGEHLPHVHMLLVPRTDGYPEDSLGPNLIANRERFLDVSAAELAAARIRARMLD